MSATKDLSESKKWTAGELVELLKGKAEEFDNIVLVVTDAKTGMVLDAHEFSVMKTNDIIMLIGSAVGRTRNPLLDPVWPEGVPE